MLFWFMLLKYKSDITVDFGVTLLLSLFAQTLEFEQSWCTYFIKFHFFLFRPFRLTLYNYFVNVVNYFVNLASMCIIWIMVFAVHLIFIVLRLTFGYWHSHNLVIISTVWNYPIKNIRVNPDCKKI